MDKYLVITDPIRSKEFAIAGEIDGSIAFHPFNEIAKEWARENIRAKSLEALSIPDGMYVSSQKRMTTSISLLLDNQKFENVDLVEKTSSIDEIKNETVFVGRKVNNLNTNKNIKNIQLRKVSSSSKINLVDYKAQYFANRAKKSSVISAIRSGVGRLNKKSASFRSKSDPSIDVLSKTAGSGLVRRLAVSSFISNTPNRLNRRSTNLSAMSEDVKSQVSHLSGIDLAIASKVRRFT